MENYISIREVASQAKVSKSTAARVISGTGSVKESTRKKVIEAAENLGYQRNALVDSWMSCVRGKSSRIEKLSIAWLDQSNQSPKHWAPLMRLYEGAEKAAEKLNLRLERIERSGRSGETLSLQRLNDILYHRNIAGCILFMPGPYYKTLFSFDRFPIVVLGDWLHDLGAPLISNAHAEDTEIAFSNLHSLGYKKIAIALPSYSNDFSQKSMYSTFLRCCQEAGQPSLIHIYENNEVDEATKWIAESKCDAVIVSDQSIKGRLEDAGFSIPKDIALAHLNVIPEEGDFAGIKQPQNEMGQLAVEVLYAAIISGKVANQQFSVRMKIAGRWQSGATVGNSSQVQK